MRSRTPMTLPSSVTSFHDYYRLTADMEEVVRALGYTFSRQRLTLPQAATLPDWVEPLRQEVTENVAVVSLTSETARRECLIAPVLLGLARHLNMQLHIEQDIDVSPQLKGSLDYFMEADGQLLVVEAKHADISRGFSQLAAELIALEQWTDSNTNTLYGAVSFGNLWQFAVLTRDTKHITQDLGQFRSPEDLIELFRILLGILNGN
ncbi:hypothetical protein [Armatimonas sp.]|uniref:hypothetical protein n=1 Tax=Armatimonas sp. TaxID=1872638 RepID=UPI0037528FFC